MKPAMDLIGHKFERLTVLERGPNDRGYTQWHCRCDCGNEVLTRGVYLTHNRVRSCGCLQRDRASESARTHGKSRSRVYSIWNNMMRRCYAPGRKDFHRYGGRGIFPCDEWHTFENFLADMGEPAAGMTLERRDNDGPYHPANCVWASRADQGKNTSRIIKVTIDGRTMPLREACDLLGKKPNTVYMRLHRGATVDEALK